MSLSERYNLLINIENVYKSKTGLSGFNLLGVSRPSYFVIKPEDNLRVVIPGGERDYSINIKNSEAILIFIPQFASARVNSGNILKDLYNFVTNNNDYNNNSYYSKKDEYKKIVEVQFMSLSEFYQGITPDITDIQQINNQDNNNKQDNDQINEHDTIVIMFAIDFYDPDTNLLVEEIQEFYYISQQLFEDDRYIKINIFKN